MDLLGAAAADRDRDRHRDARDPVLALEHDRGRPSSPSPSSAQTMRATPRPDVQVDDRPESSATCRTYQVRKYSSAAAACSAGGDRHAVHGDPVEEGNAQVAVLADHPRLDAPRRHAERLARPVRSRRLSLIV